MVPGHATVAAAGVTAAHLLVGACGAGEDLQAGTVKGLAEDLGLGLSALSGTETPDRAVEAALLCADLATLAACNAANLPDENAAVAATHLAAGAASALAALADATDGTYAENVARDARSARWKADLAVRQLGEAG